MGGLEKEAVGRGAGKKASSKKSAGATGGSAAARSAGTRKTPVRKKTGAKRPTAGARSGKSMTVTAEERERLVAEAAYYLAEGRGFVGGDPRQDWLQAEAEVDAMLLGMNPPKK